MANDLMRFSVAMHEDLLMEFDQMVARRGIMKNRSEVVRDLIRAALVEEVCEVPGTHVYGSLTVVYDHHAPDLRDKLHGIQHDYCENIVCTTHVHVDHHTCLEVIILQGEVELVQRVADQVLGLKGVETGSLSLTTTGEQSRSVQ